jgi:hypothetical protein
MQVNHPRLSAKPNDLCPSSNIFSSSSAICFETLFLDLYTYLELLPLLESRLGIALVRRILNNGPMMGQHAYIRPTEVSTRVERYV